MNPARPGAVRRIGCGALIALASAAATLLAAEIALRLLSPQALLHDPDAFTPDPLLGARLKPGFTDLVVTTEFSSRWRINADGYRGPVAGSDGVPALRIAALGDSFTFGYGVEEDQAWPRILERGLNAGRPADRRVEVVNLGVGGYGTWQETLWLEEKWGSLRPDLALVAFYVGNDPDDNAHALEASRRSPEGVAPSEGARRPPRAELVKRWLGSRWHLFSFVSTRADELLVRLGLRRLVYPFEMDVLRVAEAPQIAEAWKATRVSLERLARFCRDKGLRVIVIVVPMKHQVSDGVWRRLVEFYAGGGEAGFDRARPQRILRSLCDAQGLETIDLLDGLRGAAAVAGEDGRGFYWPRDQHWNSRGHAEAGRLIAERLTALLPLPAGAGNGPGRDPLPAPGNSR
ncbi:MAG TPA: SGNH/GDSL hydrolase family protein [Candidatus Polarisedimenticolia bacterium]|jgi:hypothetical protein